MDEQKLMQDARAYIDRVWEEAVDDIATLVSIRSVEDMDRAANGMPYGPESYKALRAALDIAKRLGLDDHDCEGHIGYADLAGARTRQIALISHTDIVPEGPGWHYDPFKLTRKDGYLIGRGVIDDKGPTVLALHAVRFFAEQAALRDEPWPYTLRVILGNNEETEMRDVEWYLEHFEQPGFLFTPDADFPLICGEKGGYSATIRSGRIAERIVELEGGTAGNAVAGEATALIRADAATLPPADRIEIEDAGDGLARLRAHGISSHAAFPEGSINAIGLLTNYLLEQGICSEAERRFLELERILFASTDGSSLGIACADDRLGDLTCIGGTIHTVDGVFEQTIDSRYPESTTGAHITEVVGALAEQYDATLTCDLDMVPSYHAPDTPAIRTLVDTYHELTGHGGEAFCIGGGTYARHFENGAAFGPNDPSDPMPDWIGAEHSADEGFSEEQLRRALLIYIVSIARLMELDL